MWWAPVAVGRRFVLDDADVLRTTVPRRRYFLLSAAHRRPRPTRASRPRRSWRRPGAVGTVVGPSSFRFPPPPVPPPRPAVAGGPYPACRQWAAEGVSGR